MRVASLAAAGLILIGGAALAQDSLPQAGPPLDGAAFDALTRGKTMDTSTMAGVYGVETFLPGQRVIWRDSDRCTQGTWTQVDDNICFLYDDKPDRPVCWTYFADGDRILGWFAGDDPVAEPITLSPADGPISCDGFLGA